MSQRRVHILEGTTSDGRRIYACGRKVKADRLEPYVGRALVKDYRSEVTCKRCLAMYPATQRQRVGDEGGNGQ